VLFDGFLSTKAARRSARLKELLDRNESFLLYESPFRVAKLIAELALQAPARQVCIGRELTKIHEEIYVGTAKDLALRFASNRSNRPKNDASNDASNETGTSALTGTLNAADIPERGEFAVMVYGQDLGGDRLSEDD